MGSDAARALARQDDAAFCALNLQGDQEPVPVIDRYRNLCVDYQLTPFPKNKSLHNLL